MEIWILLAAAGSGYLAHCWQNLQKSKEASSDISDDDDYHSGSSSHTLSSRRRYCHLSSSSRRLKACSNQNWLVSKFSDSVGKMTDGCATHFYDPVEERDEAQELQYGVILDTCSYSKTPTQFQTETFLDSLDCSMMNWYSVPCMGDSGSSSILQDESPVKLTYNILDNDMASEEGAFPYDRPWMAGYQNAFEDTSVLELSTSFPMQKHGGRSSINTRKVRSHEKNGRSRCFTRRSRRLERGLPITSSKSCFSVQYGEHRQEEDNIHFSSACEQSFNGLGEHELVEAIFSNSLLSEQNHGLLPSSRNESSRVFNKRRKSESLAGEKAVESTHFPCLPLQSNKRGRVKAWRECSASPGGDSFLLQGIANSFFKALLFNFGVGVGMMFTILSNKHGTKQLIRPEETLCSLKDLEDEVHGRTKLMFECYQTKDTSEDALTEQINALFEVVTRIFDVVEQVRNSLSQDLACISTMDHKRSKEKARLEAELEAELERMEMSLNTGDVSEVCGVSEDDLNVGNLIQGELSIRGIPCDAEVNLESDDSGDSCYEVVHDNFGVPPVELAKRLREVLEARQEREILELEAKVKHLDGRLQAKQEELQVWKQRALHRLQGSSNCESFSSFPGKEAVETTKKVLFSSREEDPCCFSVGMHHSTFDSSASLGCNEHISSSCTKEVGSLHLRVQQPRTPLSDEADNVVSEGILSDTAAGSPIALPNGLFKGAHPKDNGNRDVPLSHKELESTGFSNGATDDTWDSTPCLVKFVDMQSILHHHLEDKLNGKVGMEASSRKKHPNIDWDGEVVPICKDVSFIQDKPGVCAQDVIEISESYGQFRHTLNYWSTSEDGSYSSDLDEKLGQLLIKRIVEKSKRGSSIVEVAQSVMASFDIDETEV